MELELLEDKENLIQDSERLNEFLNENKEELKEKLDKIHADFILDECLNDGKGLVSDFQMVYKFLECIKAKL